MGSGGGIITGPAIPSSRRLLFISTLLAVAAACIQVPVSRPTPAPQPTSTAPTALGVEPTVIPQSTPTLQPAALPTAPPTPQPNPTPEPQPPPKPTAAPQPTAVSPPASEADIAAGVAPSVVQVRAGNGAGSGVKVAAGVLTNAHVLGVASRAEIVTSTGGRAAATVVRSDPAMDVALLLTDAPLPSIDLEPARQQRQGETVLVLGYARPDRIGGQPTLTRGLVSAIREDEGGVIWVQTDAAMNPGNSGGPVVNMRGKLIGLATWGIRESQGLNFAVATESIEAFLSSPPTAGSRPAVSAQPAPKPPGTRPPAKPTVPTGQAAQARVIKRYGAAVRESPSSDARVLSTAPCNAVLNVVRSAPGWRQVSTGGTTGWVGEARISEGANPPPVDCQGAVTYPVGAAVTTSVARGCLSLRRSPSRSAPFDHCVATSHRYEIINGPREVDGEDWFEVRSPSTGIGWSLAEFLRPGS